MTTPLRIAVYCQTPVASPDHITVQRVTLVETLNRCCDATPILSVYVDDGYCAHSQNRPGLQRLLQAAEARQIDCVAVLGRHHLSARAGDYDELTRVLEQKYHVQVMECEQAPARIVRGAA
ncbi:recombinase family protein [Lysobacter enzymogenes]|uniref:recombinase family protein n=1 Tax=Lysobacter enzymogenes TaxID=69 RepID=UPI00374A72B7